MAPGLDLSPGHIEREEHASLAVGGRLGRVDILADLLIQNRAACEGHRPAALVADRHHKPLLEEVLACAPDQASGDGVGHRLSSLAQKDCQVRAARREAKAEATSGLIANLAASQELSPRLTCRQLVKYVLVVLRSEPVQLDQPAPEL